MNWQRTKRLLPLAWAGLPLLGAFGETVTVENKLSTVLSPGWVIVRQSLQGPAQYNRHFPTKCYLTLKDLNGAPAGWVEEVLGQSPIPAGFEIIQTLGTSGLDKFHYNIRYRIMKTSSPEEGCAPGGSMPPVTHAPLHYDLAGLDWKRQDQARRQLADEQKALEEHRKADEAARQEAEVRAIQARR